MSAALDLERALAAWREHDAAHALHAHDRAALDDTRALRALVLEELASPRPARDLYSACARLGRQLAEQGASPSLAATTLDGAASAPAQVGASWDETRLAPARASAVEGFVTATLEAERVRGRRAWEYPACATRIADGTVAILAGLANDEEAETVRDWAARVALAVSRDGYRLAVVGGEGPARTELVEALTTIGIATEEKLQAPLPWHVRLSSIFRSRS